MVELITATKQCEGQVVDKFPLRQHLGESQTSTVFLTERDHGERAAIKFVPAEMHGATKQLAFWKRAAQLSHAHLLRMFDSGRCQLSGRNQVYAVMECADENLAEILPTRALTPAETREMLEPLLDCLGYLHGNGFVHGHLKPGNIMAIENQLKLSSDGIRQTGEAYDPAAKRSSYQPPEAGSCTLSPSADVWALGITLVEVLTQRVPDWENSAGEPVLPPSMTEPFREIARNCLKRDPNARWTVPQIKARLSAPRSLSRPAAVPVSTPAAGAVSTPAARAVSTPAAASAQPATAHRMPARKVWPLALVAVLVLAIISLIVLFRHRPEPSASTTTAVVPSKAQPGTEVSAKPSGGSTSPSSSTGAGQSDVVQQVPPKIAASAQKTIRGRIKLRVRAHVNPSGDVTRADLVSAGPSKYFARLVVDAARQWKFVPTSATGERRYMLLFDLTRSGNTAHAEVTK